VFWLCSHGSGTDNKIGSFPAAIGENGLCVNAVVCDRSLPTLFERLGQSGFNMTKRESLNGFIEIDVDEDAQVKPLFRLP